jgi:hypothetical protein
MWIAGYTRKRWINGKASARSRGGRRIYTRLAQRRSSAAPATARLVISDLRVLRRVNDMKIEKGMCLNEVGALMYCSETIMVNARAEHNLATYFPSVRWSSLTSGSYERGIDHTIYRYPP